MATTLDTAYGKLADLQLWFKIEDTDDLMLADVPAIIPLRWAYFRDRWEFFKINLDNRIDDYFEPNILRTHIASLNSFILSQRTSPTLNPFSKRSILHAFYSVFDNMPISELALTHEENKILLSEVNRVRAFTKTNFVDIKNWLRQARDELADQASGTDIDYNNIYNRNAIPSRTDIRISDISSMMLLHNGIKVIDYILANIYSLTTTTVDPFILAKTNANNSDYQMAAYKSGRLVSLNYGENLQSLASRTLDSADKWVDIAIANGLKPPYIDEIGKKIYLISNGNSNLINIAKNDSEGMPNFTKFYVNQVIYISSNTEVLADQRVIQSISEIAVSGEIILELSGEKDLDKYRLIDNASIRVYLPNTINSSFMILIPSEDPLPDEMKHETPFFLKASSEDERRAKVDLFITESNDLNLTSSGDLQVAYGLQNAAQAVKIKLEVERGTLARHPEFGLVNIGGIKTNNLIALQEHLTRSITQQIDIDPRFERLEQLSVQYVSDLHGFIVALQVRLSGSSVAIPISFSVSV